MNEHESNNLEKEAKEQTKRDYVNLAKELSERHEVFEFYGVTSEAYSKLKATAEEYPEYTTPIDELLERNKSQGIKIVIGADANSGNVYILPRDSNDVEMDNIAPYQLEITYDMNEDLKRLVELSIKHYQDHN